MKDNALNISKNYSPASQFHESFQWLKPLISFYKKDEGAKYYKVTAITANISMNENDYSNYQRLYDAHETMRMKPVNINHDRSRWVEFPRTRVDMTGAEDMSVELSLRVDDEDAWLQRALDNKNIIHPSIEGYKDRNGKLSFTALALLEKGVELPGDPLTEITSLVLNESVRNKICRLVDGELICESETCNVGEKKLSEKEKNEEAVWSTSQINDFPDSSFAFIVPGGKKDTQGKTVPRNLRKLPYKDGAGKVDLPHVRNALARLNQAQDIPANVKGRIRLMLQNFLKRASPGYEPSEKDSEKEGSVEIRLRNEIISRDRVNEELQRKISEGFAREGELKKLKDYAEGELVKTKGEIQKLIGESKAGEKSYGEKVEQMLNEINQVKEDSKVELEKTVKGYEETITSLTSRHSVEKDGLRKLHDETVEQFGKDIETLKETLNVKLVDVKAESLKEIEDLKELTINEKNTLTEKLIKDIEDLKEEHKIELGKFEEAKVESAKNIEELKETHTVELDSLGKAKDDLQSELLKQLENVKVESAKTVEELKETQIVKLAELIEAKDELQNDLTKQIEDVKVESAKVVEELKETQIVKLTELTETKNELQNELTKQIEDVKTKAVEDKKIFNEKYLKTKTSLDEKIEKVNETLKDTKGFLNDCKRINLELKSETVAAKENEDKALKIMRDVQKRNVDLSTLTRTQQEELSERRTDMETANAKYVRQLSDNDKLRQVISTERSSKHKAIILAKQLLRTIKKSGEAVILDDGTMLEVEEIEKLVEGKD